MDFTRNLPPAGPGLWLLPLSWIAGIVWVALICLPYLFLAGFAGGPEDPAAWLERKCWGFPHVVWLGLANGGLLLFALGDLAVNARGGMGLFRWVGYVLVAVLLVASQIALARWVDVAAFLAG